MCIYRNVSVVLIQHLHYLYSLSSALLYYYYCYYVHVVQAYTVYNYFTIVTKCIMLLLSNIAVIQNYGNFYIIIDRRKFIACKKLEESAKLHVKYISKTKKPMKY